MDTHRAPVREFVRFADKIGVINDGTRIRNGDAEQAVGKEFALLHPERAQRVEGSAPVRR
jgi:hypothetical protein